MKRALLIPVLSIFLISLASAQTYNCPMGGMMYGYYGGYGSSIMFIYWTLTLLVIALIIAAIYWLIKSANNKK